MTNEKPDWQEPETREDNVPYPLLPRDDILFAYRLRIYYWLSQVGIVVLIPLTINNFLQERLMAGLFTTLVAFTFGINVFFMHQNKRPPIPPVVVFFFIIMALVFVFQKLGYVAAMWIYPTMILFFFRASE